MIPEFIPRHHGQAVVALRGHLGHLVNISGIELGTGRADLTKTLLGELPNIESLITVDTWEHREGDQYEAGGFSQEHFDAAYKHAQEALAAFGNRVSILHMKSEDLLTITRRPVDFMWIDGDHKYESVVKDLELAKILVKKGGIIGGHDYGLVPDVSRAVDEKMRTEYIVHAGGDFTWWVYV